MKKEKKFVITFLILIYGVFFWFGCMHVLITFNIIDFVRTDNWQTYEPIPEKNILDKVENKVNSLKINVENRANNYFPFYVGINEFYQESNFYTNKLFYKEIPIKQNSDNEYLFYDKENQFYYYESPVEKEKQEERLKEQINFFNSLAKKDLDVYIYTLTRYEFTDLKPNNLSSYVTTFEENLDPRIKKTHMEINSIEDYKEKFYTTDHHWTMVGAIDGYNKVMDMMGKEKITDFQIQKVSDQKYYGSLAKTAMNRTINDYLYDVDLNLDYDVLINGEQPDELFKPRKLTPRKSNKYHDYYIQYFNGQYGNVVYDYHQEEKENLLILSNSFIWQIDYIIASSFNKTHVVNLRYDEYKNGDFNLTEYVEENNIQKVLFLYEAEAILFDAYDYSFVGRVK